MSTVLLEAQLRTDLGKGASRRLRRDNLVPAIIYGGEHQSVPVVLSSHKLKKALESKKIYSSVFDISVDGKVEHVILKALARHPYKPVILHMDLQRVSAKDVVVKLVPLHFINQEQAKGVKAGGIVNHNMTQVEVRCQAKDLPEHIEVDLAEVKLNDIVHLSSLKLPKGVKLTVDVEDGAHDAPIASIHLPKVAQQTAQEQPAPEADDAAQESSEGESETSK